MRNKIETGIFTQDWVKSSRRVGRDAFVALVSSARGGTNPVVVIRKESVGLTQLPTDFKSQLGHWTQLSETIYGLAERSPVIIYGGEGPSNLTPHRIITADRWDTRNIDRALTRMMARGARFARAITKAA